MAAAMKTRINMQAKQFRPLDQVATDKQINAIRKLMKRGVIKENVNFEALTKKGASEILSRALG